MKAKILIRLIFAYVLCFDWATSLAATVVVDALDSGNYNSYGVHYASDKQYRAYSCGNRGFLVFDVQGISRVTSAKLRLSVGSTSNVGVAGVGLVDPSLDVDDLLLSHGTDEPYAQRVARYNGLFTGELGRGNPDGKTEVDMPLNANGISLLNSASEQIAVGTSVIRATTGVCGTVFGGTGASSTRQLIIEVSDPVVVITSPAAGGNYYRAGQDVAIKWETTGADPADAMLIWMKRVSESDDEWPPENPENWYRFTDATPNDGSEQVQGNRIRTLRYTFRS
jgi:hypothetical protein